MAKSSLYREFIATLRVHWREAMPGIHAVVVSPGPSMPKASTFYAGMTQESGMYVFINFQHSTKAWEVGQFTVNFILSRHADAPPRTGPHFAPRSGEPFTEGSYRIGWLVGDKDKWWHLRNDAPSLVTKPWRATKYDDPATVFAEAVADVTRDVRAALATLGVTVERTTGDGTAPSSAVVRGDA